jgi:hypothetical protein
VSGASLVTECASLDTECASLDTGRPSLDTECASLDTECASLDTGRHLWTQSGHCVSGGCGGERRAGAEIGWTAGPLDAMMGEDSK